MPHPCYTRIVTVLAAAVVLLAGCGRSPQTGGPVGPPVKPATASPAELPSAPPSELPSLSPSEPVGPPSSAVTVMPDLVGRRLSVAEAALTTAGFMSVSAVDAGGRDREILDDDNWVVTRQQPVAGAAVTPGLSITLGAVKPTDTQGSPDVRKGVVPDVLCHDLQDAQDALRSAGFYVLIAKDGLGRHRYPVLDRDWVVVGQSAAAGSRPKPTGKIELTVVKYGEPTGSSGCRS